MISFLLRLFLQRALGTRSFAGKILLELVSIFLTLVIIFYASRSFQFNTGTEEGISLFVFLLAGEVSLILPVGLSEKLLNHFTDIIHSQFYQTLLGLRLSPLVYVLGKSIADAVFLLFRALAILVLSSLFLDFKLTPVMLLLFLVSQFFACVIFLLMGVIAVQFYRVFRRGLVFFYSFQSLAAIVGGVYFPVSIFPSSVKTISWLLPQTLILHVSRRIFAGAFPDLLIFSAAFGWIALLLFVCLTIEKHQLWWLKRNARFF